MLIFRVKGPSSLEQRAVGRTDPPKMRFAVIVIIAFFIVAAGIAAVFQFFPPSGNSNLASILKSFDKGMSWQSVSRKVDGQTLPFLKVIKFKEVQADGRTVLFLATRRHGLYQSFDLGNSWQLVGDQSGQVGEGAEIFDLEIAGDQVYVAIARGGFGLVLQAPLTQPLIFKPIFIGDSPQERVLAIAAGAGKIYLGTSSGGFLKSTDQGRSWQGVRWFDREVRQIELSRLRRGRIWVLAGERLFFSENDGLDWQDAGLDRVYRFWLDEAKPGRIFANTPQGVRVLSHLGGAWQSITFPSSQKASWVDVIFASFQDPNQLFAVRGNLLYVSDNNGQSWQVRALPIQRPVSSFWINRHDSAMIVLGLGQVGQPRPRKGLLGF